MRRLHLRELRRDAVALFLLLACVLGFLWPALSGQRGVYYCDGPVESIPRTFAIARIVQQGGIPLWDFNTFAGARPFYVTNESALYYPPMYPFYLLANVDDLDSGSFTLVVLPYVLHLLWAAIGAYLFARLVLHLHPAGGFVLGLMFSLSPEMAIQIMTPDVAYLFSYLPWVLLAIARYMATGRLRWWAAGTIFLALLVSAGTPNFIIRVYFIAALTACLLWLFDVAAARRNDAARGSRSNGIMRLLATASMFVLALGMNGHAWGGVLEGISWIDDDWQMTTVEASSLWGESSMPPVYLLTLLIPNFFGVLDNAHGWSIALTEGTTNIAALGGGMWITATVLAALLFWIPRRRMAGTDEILRRWVWIAAFVLVLSLFTMMGRYTPVFDVLCAVLPWFFRIPHAVYYRFAACWSLATLAAIAVSCFLTKAEFRAGVGRWWLALLCVAIAVAGASWALLHRVPVDPADLSSKVVPAYETLYLYPRQLDWFLKDPVSRFAIGGTSLLVLFLLPFPRVRAWAVVAGVTVETVAYAQPLFFDALLFEQTRATPSFEVVVLDQRNGSLRQHTHYTLAPIFHQSRQLGGRLVGYDSKLDNQAWTFGGYSLLGYSSKPLTPRFRNVVERFATGLPYQLDLRDIPEFFSNMNVTYLVNDEFDIIAGDKPIPPSWRLIDYARDLYIFGLPHALPYAYTQDRVVSLDDESQLERLVSTDLRRAAYLPPDVAPEIPRTDLVSDGPITPAEVEHFREVQALNRIRRVNRSKPNRISIEADIQRPALLVIAETWHAGWSATVDGREAPVLRVNYLQQGIWLEAGARTIQMRFCPPAFLYGAVVSAASVMLFVVVLTVAGFGKKRRN